MAGISEGVGLICHVRLSAAQSIPHSTPTNLNWDVELYKNSRSVSMHSNSVNNDRIYAPFSGFFVASCYAVYAANTTGHRHVNIFKSVDSVYDLIAASRVGALTAEEPYVTATSPPIYLGVGDFVEVRARQTSGGSLNVNADNGTAFGLYLIDRIKF